jgi:hypothetical protein
VEELICGSKGEIARLFFLFPEFPLDENGLALLGIKHEVQQIMGDFEQGNLNEDAAFERLKQLCRDDAFIPS